YRPSMVDGRAALRNAFNRRTYNPRAIVIRSTLSVLTGPVCRNNGFNTYIGSNYLCGTGYLGCSNGKSRISGLCHYFIYHYSKSGGELCDTTNPRKGNSDWSGSYHSCSVYALLLNWIFGCVNSSAIAGLYCDCRKRGLY